MRKSSRACGWAGALATTADASGGRIQRLVLTILCHKAFSMFGCYALRMPLELAGGNLRRSANMCEWMYLCLRTDVRVTCDDASSVAASTSALLPEQTCPRVTLDHNMAVKTNAIAQRDVCTSPESAIDHVAQSSGKLTWANHRESADGDIQADLCGRSDYRKWADDARRREPTADSVLCSTAQTFGWTYHRLHSADLQRKLCRIICAKFQRRSASF